MSRKKRARRSTESTRNRRKKTYSQRVKRNSTNIRFVPIETTVQRQYTSRNNLTPKTYNSTQKQEPNLLRNTVQKFMVEERRVLCRQKKARGDAQRRRKFFRAKSKGNANARPEHIRKYNGCE